MVLLAGCGTVERGKRCDRHSDCQERAASCEIWSNASGEARRTCEIPCDRDVDCPEGELCTLVGYRGEVCAVEE